MSRDGLLPMKEGGDAMPTLSILPPNKKQKQFLKAVAKHIGFGGA